MSFSFTEEQRLKQIADSWRLTPATMATHLTRGKWVPVPHLLLASAKIATGLYKGGLRLCLEMPPRHGKSELASVNTPMYHFDHWPHKNVILTSYGADLAEGFSRRVRDGIREYQGELRCKLSPTKQEVSHFMTTEGGQMFSAGLGGVITGRGGDLVVLDDYIKNAKHSLSEIQRESDWQEFTSTVFTRLEPKGSVLVLATRWHVDDIIGRVRSQFPEDWETIKIKAICEDTQEDPLGRAIGEPIWPDRYNYDALMEIKATLGTYFWKALYQQEPIAGMSGLFQGRWLQVIDIIPHPNQLSVVRFWDTAASEDAGDYTVGTLMAEDRKSKLVYIIDQKREQFAAGRVEALIRQTAEEDRDMYPNYEIGMEEEPGASGKMATNHYAKDVLKGFVFTGKRITGPAEVRARPFLAAAETSQIYMRQAPWNKRLREEFEAFPDGLHDDQVISTAGAYNMLKMRHLKGGVTWGRNRGSADSTAEDYVVRGPGKSVKITGATFGRRRDAR